MGNAMLGNFLEPPVDQRWLDQPTQADLVIPGRLHGDIVVMSLDRGVPVSDVLVELLGDRHSLSLNTETVRALAELSKLHSAQDPPVDESIEWTVGFEFELTKAAQEAGVPLNDLVVGLLYMSLHPKPDKPTPDPTTQPIEEKAPAIV